MATLAVLAHFDPHGEVANHVRFAIDALRPVADRLVFVTAGSLTPQARARLETVDAVVERDNRGYDFYSWRTGLLGQADWTASDRIILANDSIVGPLIPLADLLAPMAAAQSDVFGITASPQGGLHIQSYFTVLGQAAASHPAVGAFWREMTPLDDRTAVIERYELGLGETVSGAGLKISSYFTPTPHEERLMAARMASFHRSGMGRPAAAAAAYALQPVRQAVESPILGLWDRVFDDARLPAVKVSLFSRDPYRIDRGAALARLTDLFPAAFDGFGAYLSRVGVTW